MMEECRPIFGYICEDAFSTTSKMILVFVRLSDRYFGDHGQRGAQGASLHFPLDPRDYSDIQCAALYWSGPSEGSGDGGAGSLRPKPICPDRHLP